MFLNMISFVLLLLLLTSRVCNAHSFAEEDDVTLEGEQDPLQIGNRNKITLSHESVKENVGHDESSTVIDRPHVDGAGGEGDAGGESHAALPRLLIVSTLNGSVYVLDGRSGQIKRRLRRKPAVRSPASHVSRAQATFLPDPSDGSLYMLDNHGGGDSGVGGGSGGTLHKLPFTVPELVAVSPCRTADGVLYTGSKVDDWMTVDSVTGSLLDYSGHDEHGAADRDNNDEDAAAAPDSGDKTGAHHHRQRSNSDGRSDDRDSCPVEPHNTLFLGRSEYTVTMHDSKAGSQRWNVTYTRYSAPELPVDKRDTFNMVVLSTSSTGLVVCVTRDNGQRLWQTELDSPVVSVFAQLFGTIYSVPHTTVAMETLSMMAQGRLEATRLVPTLYIGEHTASGMYALPSLVDDTTVHVISGRSRLPLIEGPQSGGAASGGATSGGAATQKPGSYFKLVDEAASQRSPRLLIGHHHVPSVTKSQLTPLVTTSNKSLPSSTETRNNDTDDVTTTGPHDDVITTSSMPAHLFTYLPLSWVKARVSRGDGGVGDSALPPTDSTPTGSLFADTIKLLDQTPYTLRTMLETYTSSLYRILHMPIAELSLVALTTSVALMVVVMTTAILTIRSWWWWNHHSSPPLSSSTPPSAHSSRSDSAVSSRGSQRHVTAHPELLSEGVVRVGSITFDSDQCLGKGCEGTFVFRGWFDSRDVAVKRLLPECFLFADREVQLLRESDQHPNVIRYFCTEQDRQFRYIALELCAGTVQDYVQKRYTGPDISPLDILRQATAGLAHLHALNIVHRDVKPHNVLLSSRAGQAVAMISDFGLCKKLSGGRKSFSRRSGVAGTDGWIAPEMIDGQMRATCAVDVFSMGCVMYYVLSDGHHPFGESFKRQYNILDDKFSLDEVEDPLVKSLVSVMLSVSVDQRPRVSSVLQHPVFWHADTVLQFLQELSDRIERESSDSPLLRRVERRGWEVTGGDWRERLHAPLLADLAKFRSYRGSSVRDLLRALRNKRNHLRSLDAESRQLFGSSVEQFCEYWQARFPRLLAHCWCAAQHVRHEPAFHKYYKCDFVWTLEPDPKAVPPWRRKQSPPPPAVAESPQNDTTSTAAAVVPPDGSTVAGQTNNCSQPPGSSLTDALRLSAHTVAEDGDSRAVMGSNWDEVGRHVRQRLVDIVQEGGVHVPDASHLVNSHNTTTPHNTDTHTNTHSQRNTTNTTSTIISHTDTHTN